MTYRNGYQSVGYADARIAVIERVVACNKVTDGTTELGGVTDAQTRQ
jgi:hypothetical protein